MQQSALNEWISEWKVRILLILKNQILFNEQVNTDNKIAGMTGYSERRVIDMKKDW